MNEPRQPNHKQVSELAQPQGFDLATAYAVLIRVHLRRRDKNPKHRKETKHE